AAACQPGPAPTLTAPRDSLWLQLSLDEAKSVSTWLCQQPVVQDALQTGNSSNNTACDSLIASVGYLAPNKSLALAYLDGKTDVLPRYAQAKILLPNAGQSFAIGPLPISNQTTMQPLYIFTRNETDVPPDDDFPDPTDWEQVFNREMSAIADIIQDLVGPVPVSILESMRRMGLVGLSDIEDGRRIVWVEFYADTSHYDTGLALPQGLYLKFELGNSTQFKGVLYNNIMYDSSESFRKAWSSPGFEKTPYQKPGTWITGDRTGPEMAHDTQPPPLAINPEARYSIDANNRYVSWMDFTFYLGTTPDGGVGLHEVRYKGERIIFELGLMEAVAHYASNDPIMSRTFYLDATFGMGSNLVQLVPGYDCPATASFLDSGLYSVYSQNLTNQICIFERDAGYPLARHNGGGYVSVIKNNILTVRSISTIGNYDYLLDYAFYYDGGVEVTVRASGYIEGAYYAKNDGYGYRIHEGMSGAMHDHVLNFKLDMDINGTANTLERIDVNPVTASFSWTDQKLNTMKIDRSFIENEDQGKINWAPNSASMYTVVNKDAKNQWGELRGYRLIPGSVAHLTVQNSTIAGNSVNFATNHLFVTKQKDSELKVSTMENAEYPNHPLIDFNKFFDGENLVQEDLVLWFNLGMHHVPHCGDLPYTVFSTAQSSMMISPHNFLDSSPIVQSNQAIKI
ncbi:amine oxidase catalytic domain-containing protein, partial [Thozetella sp. PMI_491]